MKLHEPTTELANRYLLHLADVARLPDDELHEAETAYVVWDWDGLAALAYEQYLLRGRGAFVGPRTVVEPETVTVVFDYAPSSDTALGGLAGDPSGECLSAQLDHYHPELEFIVVWLRGNGAARSAILSSNKTTGLLPPRDIYYTAPVARDARPN